MKNTGVKWIDRSLVLSPYCIGLCKTQESFKKELKRLKVDKPAEWITKGSDATTNFFERTDTHSYCCLVGIDSDYVAKRKIKPSEVAGILTHEAEHIWREIKKVLGEDKPSSEFEAYAVQNIAQRLIEAYNEKN